MLSLATIIINWLKRDPLLNTHMRLNTYDGEGFWFVCSCGPMGAHGIGYVPDGTRQQIRTREWKFKNATVYYSKDRLFHLADPQFFEKLKIGLIKAHNSLSKSSQCVIKVPKVRKALPAP